MFLVGAEVHSVRQWLDSFGLAHLEDVLLTNGFDDIDFLVCLSVKLKLTHC